jgi:hypothetical protein
MAIVYGWNSFKIREFTLDEVGIHKKAEPGVQLEVRQAYFHLFWIPMFSLGKRWVVRKGGKSYEMPADIKTLAKKTLTNIKTPWYTYAGPLAIVISVVLFVAITKAEESQSLKRAAAEQKKQIEEVKYRLAHLTTKDFITVKEKAKDYNNGTLYMKVEDINGDVITATRVEINSGSPMVIEDAYKQHSGTLPSVKLSRKALLSATEQEVDLMKNEFRHQVTDVVRHFGPIIKDGHTGQYGSDAALRFYNAGWTATVTDMKTLVGNADWSQNINKVFPGGQSEYQNDFFLKGKNFNYNEPYKFVMTLKDTAGVLHKIEVEGNKKEKTIREL